MCMTITTSTYFVTSVPSVVIIYQLLGVGLLTYLCIFHGRPGRSLHSDGTYGTCTDLFRGRRQGRIRVLAYSKGLRTKPVLRMSYEYQLRRSTSTSGSCGNKHYAVLRTWHTFNTTGSMTYFICTEWRSAVQLEYPLNAWRMTKNTFHS